MKFRLLLFLPLIVLIAFSCTNEVSDHTETIVQQEAVNPGEEAAKMYCQACHQFPEPSLLDYTSWEKYMLPRMGYMLGIYPDSTVRDSLIEPGRGGQLVEAANIFPKTPTIPADKWALIQAYYLDNAPAKLPAVPRKEITMDLGQFEVIIPQFTVSPPSITLLQFSDHHTIYAGDANSETFLEFDANFKLIKSGNVKQGAVSLMEKQNELWLTIMGSFSPTDNPTGFILTMPKTGGQLARVPIAELSRPVHTAYGDLNKDGFTDAVICEFGKWTGQLSIITNDGKDNFTKKTLIQQTGALKSELYDFNGDGALDIIALFGQGNECVYILYNDGKGNFRKEQVLQFSPSNGSSSFNLFDYNADGFMDIIYTAGDNADFQPVMKPYHGVYIFQNDGKNKFEQVYFYQLNGAYGAIPADYDLDGDLDIAAISFFPDYANTPDEGFVYLENQGNNDFIASSFKNAQLGRWIVMDAGDLDQDGDLDLILGSLAFEVIPKNDDLIQGWIDHAVPFIYLKNKQIE